MGYSVTKDQTYKATEGGGNDYKPFPPLEAGPVAVVVYEAEIGEYKSEANKGRPQVRMQLKVLDGQKGANKRLFETVGIFEKWGPTTKNPDGSDNFTFFNFFAAATGKTEKEFRKWFEETEDPFADLPSPSQLEGRKVIATVKIEADDYGYNKALEQFASDEGLNLKADRQAVEDAFKDSTGFGPDDYKTNRVSGYKVYDGKIPEAGAAQTASPKIAAVEL